MLHLSINKTPLCLQIQATFPNHSTLQMLRARHPDSTPCFKLPTKITKHLGPDPWKVAPGRLHLSLHSSFATFVLLSYRFNRLLHTQQSFDLSPELKIPAMFCSSCVLWLLLCWSQAYQVRTVQSATSSHLKTRSLLCNLLLLLILKPDPYLSDTFNICASWEESLLHFKYSLSKFTLWTSSISSVACIFTFSQRVEGDFVYFLKSPVHLFFLKQGSLLAWSSHIRLHWLAIEYWVFVCPHIPCDRKRQQILSVCLCVSVHTCALFWE